jgi:peptidoglycan/LPS O-acetylase OafA/YrhL
VSDLQEPSRISTKSASTARATAHIPSLDGIRAVSFLLVFLAHTGLENIVPGGLGVTIFFFLSGFLITTLMRDELQRKGSVSLSHFWIRRVLRILPPFYIVLVAAILFTLALYPPGSLSVPAVVAQLLHFTNYWAIYRGFVGQPPGTGVYWSLAVEEHFYLIFPWLFVGMQRLRLSAAHQAVLLWGLCILTLLWRYMLVLHFHAPTDRTYIASDTRMDSILFGCALAVWRNPVLDKPARSERLWKYLLTPAAAALLIFCLVVRDPVFRETARYSLQGAALTMIFVAAITFHRWWPFRLLNTRPLIFLGTLSYSLYLIHQVVLYGLDDLSPLHTHPVASAVVAFALSLTLSWTLYLSVEKPCARLRRRLTD